MKPYLKFMIKVAIAVFLISSSAQAQTTYVPLYCDAKLPTGTDYTSGKDSGGKPCYKLANTKGFTVYHGKEGITYQVIIDSDIIVMGESYIILRKASKDVAWFDREYVVGWRAN